MKIYALEYYREFKCAASDCVHSCCVGWEIDVDADTLNLYKTIKGSMGRRLAENISQDAVPHFILKPDGRCPFLNNNGLCEIITQLGEDALCDICFDHPRYRNYFSDRTELGLGLCCEAAAKLILSQKGRTQLIVLNDDGEEIHPDENEKELFSLRDKGFSVIQDRNKKIDERTVELLKLFDCRTSVLSAEGQADFCLCLERLDPNWEKYLKVLKTVKTADALSFGLTGSEVFFEQLIIYFFLRHFNMENFEKSPSFAAFFCVQSYLIIKKICAAVKMENGKLSFDEVVDICRMYSSEIEYSEENMRAFSVLHLSSQK